MSRSGGRVGLRDESQDSGVFRRRRRIVKVSGKGLAPFTNPAQGPQISPIAREIALRLTSLIQRSSMGLTEGIAWTRHGLSTSNPQKENKQPNKCGNFFLQARPCSLDASKNPRSGAMLHQSPHFLLAASGQGSAV